MVNCTAAQYQGWTAEVYGDYMDGIESIVFNQSCDLSRVNLIKYRIGVFGAPFVV